MADYFLTPNDKLKAVIINLPAAAEEFRAEFE